MRRALFASVVVCGCQLALGRDCESSMLAMANDAGDESIVVNPNEEAGTTLVLCNVEAPFSVPVPLTALNTNGHETAPVLTADELTIFYIRDTEIWTASRTSKGEPFGTTTPVKELEDVNSTTSGLAITGDGLTLFISRLRYTNTPNALRQIWMTHRESRNDPFGPLSMSPASTSDWEFEIGVGAMSQDLYITMQEAGPPYHVEMNLVVSDYRNGTYKPPRPFFKVNDLSMSEHGPAISFNERSLYYARRVFDDAGSPDGGAKPPKASSSDVYLSTRVDTYSPFGEPAKIPELSDPTRGEQPSWVSQDQCRLYLQIIPGAAMSNWDLYVASRQP